MPRLKKQQHGIVVPKDPIEPAPSRTPSWERESARCIRCRFENLNLTQRHAGGLLTLPAGDDDHSRQWLSGGGILDGRVRGVRSVDRRLPRTDPESGSIHPNDRPAASRCEYDLCEK